MRTHIPLTTLVGAATLALMIAAVDCPADWMFYSTHDADIGQLDGGGDGSDPHMIVRNSYGAGGIGKWELDALVRFDISSIPTGTSITSATLNLYYYGWWDNNPAGHPLTCYRITSGWDEADVTWITRPSWLPDGQWTDSAKVPGSTGTWMTWDVTADVQAFVDGAESNFGWIIRDETYWGKPNIPMIGFRSKEYGSVIPFLEVVPTPAALALLALASFAPRRRRS